MAFNLPLRRAIARQREIPHFLPNAYGWYRDQAARTGEISVGSSSVRACKVRGRWMVDGDQFERAIVSAKTESDSSAAREAASIAYLKARKRI